MSKFLPFEEALVVSRSLGLATQFEWKVCCKEGMRPAHLPTSPDKTYKDGGWQGWVHWLGSSGIKPPSKFAPFDQALAFAHSLGLASEKAWRVWRKSGMRPATVPASPERTYKDAGWQGWGHWLGTGNTRRSAQLLPFAEALDMARSLNLASAAGWRVLCKEGMCPPNVPAAPDKSYKDGGWQGWAHWLGSGGIKKASKFVPFGEALAFAQSLGLANTREWEAWCKEGRRPPNVPSHPHKTYKDAGWQGWGHWLGTGNQRTKTTPFLEFDKALLVARSLRLDSQAEWRMWCKSGARPANVPAAPEQAYVHDGWMGYTHWLYHANLDAPTAPAPAPSTRKRGRAATGGTGKGRRKRRRR